MTFAALRTYALKTYYPALFIERVVAHKRFVVAKKILYVITLLLLIASVLVFITVNSIDNTVLDFWALKIYGLFFIAFSIWMISAAVQAFYYAFYFKGLSDANSPINVLFGFELAHILYRSTEADLIRGFLKTREGKSIISRAGINKKIIETYLSQKKNIVDTNNLGLSQDANYISVTDYVSALYDADKEFMQFLFNYGIQKKDLLAITEWVVEKEATLRDKQRWWSRNRLGRVPGIGKNWSYGRIWNLEKYSRNIPFVQAQEYEVKSIYGENELKQLESILVKTREANVLLVSNDKEEKLQIIAKLNNMIEEGKAFPELEHKRMILIDTELLISTQKTKAEFEQEFMKIMNEAVYAGNMIVIFEDMPAFMSSTEAIGADAVSLLDPYLTSGNLQIIGFSDTERFHQVLERNVALMQRFEKILIENIDDLNVIRVLENEIIKIEKNSGLYFTYQALTTIAESATRYFPEATMPDKAIDLLFELVPKMTGQNKRIVEKEDVLSLVQVKTGIPVGEVQGIERDKLLNLEKILHQRIIGQDEAVVAISNAVRRARSGINNPNRPMGSFLFLGPTGVGKTETTKALSEIFFGSEAKIERLDMSEYSGLDAVSKLIGVFGNNRNGVLATLIREHPYGVLLLDEFEKTTPEVMNLFLQILDEGFFSDMTGKKINARNLLIIATSNAGSELIWDAVKHGDDLSHAKDLIVDAIIKAQIFKPELLNRFDGLIVFHPLAKEHLEKIAKLQLEKLKARIAPRGINLVINQDLINFVMKSGTDPKFGARPMNRAIQDKVEQIIAEKMIRGDFQAGSEIVLTQGELR